MEIETKKKHINSRGDRKRKKDDEKEISSLHK
jgi:hypothetical protein